MYVGQTALIWLLMDCFLNADESVLHVAKSFLMEALVRSATCSSMDHIWSPNVAALTRQIGGLLGCRSKSHPRHQHNANAKAGGG